MLEQIHSEKAPKALGPYSQGIKTGEFLFVSGQLPIDPLTSQLIEGDIKTLTKQVLKNLEEVLIAGGCTLQDVVRTDIFLIDLKDFKAMNEAYGEVFQGPVYPARQTIQTAGLPLGSLIEISCIAHISKEKMHSLSK